VDGRTPRTLSSHCAVGGLAHLTGAPAHAGRLNNRDLKVSRATGKFHLMNEIMFEVTDAQEGGFPARALGTPIFTEADTLPELREALRDAVRCHFEEGEAPSMIRLHYVREEVFAA
jgi:hypothetical protein